MIGTSDSVLRLMDFSRSKAKEFAQDVKNARETFYGRARKPANRLSREGLADLSGVTESAILRIETFETKEPLLQNITSLAIVLSNSKGGGESMKRWLDPLELLDPTPELVQGCESEGLKIPVLGFAKNRGDAIAPEQPPLVIPVFEYAKAFQWLVKEYLDEHGLKPAVLAKVLDVPVRLVEVLSEEADPGMAGVLDESEPFTKEPEKKVPNKLQALFSLYREKRGLSSKEDRKFVEILAIDSDVSSQKLWQIFEGQDLLSEDLDLTVLDTQKLSAVLPREDGMNWSIEDFLEFVFDLKSGEEGLDASLPLSRLLAKDPVQPKPAIALNGKS